ncbi:hypothetical protein [Nocardia asteroides]|uniref:hypothetical protein n=1 Tax=Nocardia asteroides TaxID=1824 RepID=UPI001E5C427F|nr:hypothetical protein [Nocardia asteroides]UGT64415.1 hypothetical protein LTT61_14490 [Nocardia asteroides]
MEDPQDRIVKLQTILAAIVVAVIGVALMVFEAQLPHLPEFAWLAFFPWSEVGGTLLVAGVLGLGIDYVTSRDRDRRDTARLTRVLRDSAPVMRDAVIEGFAFGREDLARVTSPETLDDVIVNSLALRLGDKTFAAEVYNDIRAQAVKAPERWHDASVEIRLSPLPATAGSRNADGVPTDSAARPALFSVSVRWEYDVIPARRAKRFAVTSDWTEYTDLLKNDPGTSAWFLSPKPGVHVSDREAFELVQFTVDGRDRPIRRATRKNGQVYTVDLGSASEGADKPIRVAYTYRTVTEQRGNLLYVDIEQPTRGVTVELDYGDCAVERVSVVDFIASSRGATIERSPESVPGKVVRVAFDGWALPRSGVGFIWVLGSSDTAE